MKLIRLLAGLWWESFHQYTSICLHNLWCRKKLRPNLKAVLPQGPMMPKRLPFHPVSTRVAARVSLVKSDFHSFPWRKSRVLKSVLAILAQRWLFVRLKVPTWSRSTSSFPHPRTVSPAPRERPYCYMKLLPNSGWHPGGTGLAQVLTVHSVTGVTHGIFTIPNISARAQHQHWKPIGLGSNVTT